MSSPEKVFEAIVREVMLRLFEESLPRVLKCLQQLDDDQIWWRPNNASNSIGNLVLHLSGNVNQWINTGLGGDPDHRKRQLEFDQHGGVSRQELITHLQAVMERARLVISNMEEEELLRKRPVQTFEETGLSILIHVTEHFSYHTGQIAYITKMITNQDLGFYHGIKLE